MRNKVCWCFAHSRKVLLVVSRRLSESRFACEWRWMSFRMARRYGKEDSMVVDGGSYYLEIKGYFHVASGCHANPCSKLYTTSDLIEASAAQLELVVLPVASMGFAVDSNCVVVLAKAQEEADRGGGSNADVQRRYRGVCKDESRGAAGGVSRVGWSLHRQSAEMKSGSTP